MAEVRDGIAAELAAPCAEAGFRFRRRDATFLREADGRTLSIELGISSRPPSLGGVGVLLEPAMVVSVAAWADDARRRLANSSAPPLWEHPTAVIVWEMLCVYVAGRRPHWTLPDAPTAPEITERARSLRSALVEVGLPFLERLASRARLLELAASGEAPVLHDARFTLACGALLEGRPDRARAVIEPLGTARRMSAAAVLGLDG